MALRSAQEADLVEKIRVIHQDSIATMPDHRILEELEERRATADPKDIVDQIVLGEYEIAAAHRGLIRNPGAMMNPKRKRKVSKPKSKAKRNPGAMMNPGLTEVTRAANAGRYLQRYTVTGSGRFPLDMLRYDYSWVHPAEDYRGREPRSHTVYRYVGTKTDREYPTDRRWESFGWTVSDVDYEKVDRPLKMQESFRIAQPVNIGDLGELKAWPASGEDVERINAGEGGVGLRRLTATKADTLDFEVLPENFDGEILELAPYGAQWGNPGKKRLVAGGKVPKGLSKTMAKRKAKAKATAKAKKNPCKRSVNAFLRKNPGCERFYWLREYSEVDDGVSMDSFWSEKDAAIEAGKKALSNLNYSNLYVGVHEMRAAVAGQSELTVVSREPVWWGESNPKRKAKAKKNPCIGLHFHAKDADELMEAAEKPGKRQGNPKKKLYSKLLITKSHRLWQTYDEKPLKKHLLAFGEHIEVMKASGEAELKEETRNATRAFKAELKKHGWKKPAAKRKSKARKNPIGLGRHGNIYVPAEATAEQIAEILNEDQRIASDVQADGYATTHGLGRKVHNDMLLAGEVPGWKMWEHQYTFQPIHGWPEERSHYRIAPEPESNPRKKKASKKKSTKKKAAKKKTLGGRAKRAGRKIEKRGKVLAVDAERGAEKAGRKLKKYGATKQGYTVAGAGLGAILLGPLGAVAGAMGGSALHDNPGAMMNPTALNEKLRLRLPEMSDKEVVDVYEQYYTMYTKSARPEMDYGEEGVELSRSVIKDTSEEIRRRDWIDGMDDIESNPKKKKGSKLKTKAKKAGRKAKKFAKTKEGYGALGAGAGALLLGPIGAVAGAIGGTKLHGNPGRRKNPTKGQHHALADRKWNMFESSWDSFSISNSPEDLLGAYMAVVQAELHYAHAGIENDEGRGYGPAGAEAEGIRQQISERLGG